MGTAVVRVRQGCHRFPITRAVAPLRLPIEALGGLAPLGRGAIAHAAKTPADPTHLAIGRAGSFYKPGLLVDPVLVRTSLRVFRNYAGVLAQRPGSLRRRDMKSADGHCWLQRAARAGGPIGDPVTDGTRVQRPRKANKNQRNSLAERPYDIAVVSESSD